MGMLNAVPANAPRMPSFARSLIRRIPWITAAWPAEIAAKRTAAERIARSYARSGLPKVSRLMLPLSSAIASSPARPVTSAALRTARRVREMDASSPVPTAPAICRTPLSRTPIPATVRTRSVMVM